MCGGSIISSLITDIKSRKAAESLLWPDLQTINSKPLKSITVVDDENDEDEDLKFEADFLEFKDDVFDSKVAINSPFVPRSTFKINESIFDSLAQSKSSRRELASDIIVKAYVIKKCLELWYNTWVISSNVVPLSDNPFPAFNGSDDGDFHIGKGSRIFVAKSSSSSQNIWGETFVQKLSDTVESLVDRDDTDFISVIEKFFGNVGLRITVVDETEISLKLETADTNQTASSCRKVISWSPATDIDLVRERLERLGMWIIDADSSCKAVVCHQS